MTEQELYNTDFRKKLVKKLSAKTRATIYKRNRAGESKSGLAIEYGVSRNTIHKYIKDMSEPAGLKNIYWRGSIKKDWAERAKQSELTISKKYNTLSGRKIDA